MPNLIQVKLFILWALKLGKMLPSCICLLSKTRSSIGVRRFHETRGGEGCQECDVRNGEFWAGELEQYGGSICIIFKGKEISWVGISPAGQTVLGLGGDLAGLRADAWKARPGGHTGKKR